MGTTNRSFNRHSRRAAMSNTAKNSRRHQRRKDERNAKKEQAIKSSRTFYGHIKYALLGFLGIFGYGRGGASIARTSRPAAFTTPTHSAPWRSAAELLKRKMRRQKRQRLILTRGYAWAKRNQKSHVSMKRSSPNRSGDVTGSCGASWLMTCLICHSRPGAALRIV